MVDWVARALGIIGTVVSTVGVTVQLLQRVRDRGRIRVEADFLLRADRKKLVIQVKAINVGLRSVTVKGIRLRHEGGQEYVWTDLRNMPKKLEQSDDATEISEDIDQIKDVVTSLYVFDSENKHWELSQEKLNLLKENANERRAKEAVK